MSIRINKEKVAIPEAGIKADQRTSDAQPSTTSAPKQSSQADQATSTYLDHQRARGGAAAAQVAAWGAAGALALTLNPAALGVAVVAGTLYSLRFLASAVDLGITVANPSLSGDQKWQAAKQFLIARVPVFGEFYEMYKGLNPSPSVVAKAVSNLPPAPAEV